MTTHTDRDVKTIVDPASTETSVAVLIPCLNEERSVAQVVEAFMSTLPKARIYVYDNGSTDRTAALASAAGAEVRHVARRGKGNVLRRMFADIDADVYIIVDGDMTYDATSARRLVQVMLEGRYDMVNVARVAPTQHAYRKGHQLGNKVLTGLVGLIFGYQLKDILSGYKALSRRFVKTFPALSLGFETETELVVHALDLQMPMIEIDAPYSERQTGSDSKLNTWRDGIRILRMIARLTREERPLPFFTTLAILLMLGSLALGGPVIIEFMQTGLVPRLPTALLATGIMMLGFLSLTCGLVLDTVTRGRKETKLLRYLALPAPGHSTNDHQRRAAASEVL